MGKVWTKDAEREQLRKIQALIEETEIGSYIRMSFSGICEMCEQNITDDACDNMPDAIAFREKEIAELRKSHADAEKEASKRLLKVEHERDVAYEQLKQSREAYEEKHQMWCKATDAVAELRKELEQTQTDARQYRESTNEVCDELETEIVRLKAEIYDLRKECERK